MDPRLLAVAEHQGGVFTTADAARLDLTESDLRVLIAHEEVRRVRRGAYVLEPHWRGARPEHQLGLRTRAVMRTRPGDVACHQSALALHEMPLHGVRLDIVDLGSAVTRVRLASGLRTAPWSGPVVTVDGYRCVPLAHAVAQVLTRSGLLAALVPLDAALHARRCSLDLVEGALRELCGEGSLAAQRLLRLADPKCDSVGETRTRLLLHDLGYAPLTQISIHDAQDSFVAKVDFLIGTRVVVEFDGLMKYAGADGRAALAKEKRREDRLRALGYAVVRLTWADLDHPARVATMIQRALALTGRTAS